MLSSLSVRLESRLSFSNILQGLYVIIAHFHCLSFKSPTAALASIRIPKKEYLVFPCF